MCNNYIINMSIFPSEVNKVLFYASEHHVGVEKAHYNRSLTDGVIYFCISSAFEIQSG